MSKIASGVRYHDDPRCRECEHPKVVHQGERHAGRCIALECVCRAFA